MASLSRTISSTPAASPDHKPSRPPRRSPTSSPPPSPTPCSPSSPASASPAPTSPPLSSRIRSYSAPAWRERCPPRVDGFAGLGLSSPDIARLISLVGSHFRLRSIVSNLQFHLSLFGSSGNLLRMLERNSYLVGTDLEKVKPNVALLRQCGLGTCDISKVCIHAPRMLTAKLEHAREMVACAEGLGVPRGSGMFRQALQAVAFLSEEKIADKVYLKKTFRWSNAEVSFAMTKAPMLLRRSKDMLRRRSEFLISVVGLEPAYIAHRPVMLYYSMEGRLRPRYYVLKFLKEYGFLDCDGSFYSAITMADNVFLKNAPTGDRRHAAGLPTALGSIALSLSAVQAACYPLAAYLAERHDRLTVIALGAFLWAAGRRSFPWSALSFAAMWLELVGFSHGETAALITLFKVATSLGGLFGGNMGDVLARRLKNSDRIILSHQLRLGDRPLRRPAARAPEQPGELRQARRRAVSSWGSWPPGTPRPRTGCKNTTRASLVHFSKSAADGGRGQHAKPRRQQRKRSATWTTPLLLRLEKAADVRQPSDSAEVELGDLTDPGSFSWRTQLACTGAEATQRPSAATRRAQELVGSGSNRRRG
ncbi:hypothetical protein ACQ4PT_031995 [Festuca glaucescens]